MNPIIVYDRLADVAADLYLAIAYLSNVTPAERCALEALWVRLDDLVEQIPKALEALTAYSEEE